MRETEVFIKSGGLKLEGLYIENPGKKGVVVCHPHPLYGGNMQNNVVEAIVNAYDMNGYSTLRFNFRGTGRSEGRHENGTGEQDDLISAVNFLKGKGKSHIDISGYSFGAWIISKTINEKGLKDMGNIIFVSPPVGFMDFSFLKHLPELGLIIVGSNDYIAPYKEIKMMINDWNPDAKFKIIKGTDHFYFGMEEEIERVISEFLREQE